MGMGEKSIVHKAIVPSFIFLFFKYRMGYPEMFRIRLPWMLSYFPTPAASKIEIACKAKQTATARIALRNAFNDQAAKSDPQSVQPM